MVDFLMFNKTTISWEFLNSPIKKKKIQFLFFILKIDKEKKKRLNIKNCLSVNLSHYAMFRFALPSRLINLLCYVSSERTSPCIVAGNLERDPRLSIAMRFAQKGAIFTLSGQKGGGKRGGVGWGG